MNKPLIWAHRGASGYAPENTLIAFQKAVDLKADGVELDVQRSKDGVLVVCHDETIDRTSDGKGWIQDLTFEELRSYNFNTRFKEFGNQKIPTFEEVLNLLKPTGLTINIELKTGVLFYPGIEKEVVEMVHACGMEEHVVYSSFNHASCLKVRECNPNAYLGFLNRDGFIGYEEYAKAHGVQAIHPPIYHLQYPDVIADCKRLGLDINVWAVDEEKYMRMCIEMGVHAIITNYPDVARKVLKEYE
ncbi:MAG: glycerophosphodiester phosphodiesterase [Solobacterium sp.]|nr:glycerophosphodiester phosphodiesterase [Solobacterium sp.]